MTVYITNIILVITLWAGEGFGKDEQDRVFNYNEQLGIFEDVPMTAYGVEKLLSIGREHRNSDPQKSAHASLQALNLAGEIGYKSGMAGAYNDLGITYQLLGDFDQALAQFQSALEIETEREDKKRIGTVMNSIARIYLSQNNYEDARIYYSEAVDVMAGAGIPEIKAISLMNLGLIFHELGEYQTALEYYDQILELTHGQAEHQQIIMEVHVHIGNAFMELEEFERAESYLTSAAGFFKRKNNAYQQIESGLSLSRLYMRWGRFDEAVDHINRSLELAEAEGQLHHTMRAYSMLSEIHELQNDFPGALEFYKRYHAVHDSLLNSERAARINQRQIRFDLEQKNKQIAHLSEMSEYQEAQISRQELWGRFLFIGLVLSMIIAGLLYRNVLLKKKAHMLERQQGKEIERQNRMLMHLNEEKDAFLGMAAHDLRNPLAAIRGVISLMEDDERSEDSRHLLDLIKTSSARMLTLINNFLNVENIEQGFNTNKMVPVDLRKPLEQVTDSFCKTAEKKQISLSVSIAPDSKPVLADPDILQSIIENLVSNAIKFSPPGASVVIATEMQSDWMDIHVRDNGPGITEKDKQQMFKRFSPLSNKPTGNETSTGLGLFIVKKLTEAMGGRIRYESKRGAGSTFTVTLPVAVNSEFVKVNS